METEKRKTKGNVMDMTSGSPLKLILIFAIPLLIGNIFQEVYTLADTMVAGYCLGDNAIASIGATSSLYSLIIDFASGLNSGCAIVATRCFGAHDEKKLKASFAGMILINIVSGIILTTISLLLLRPLLGLLETPASIFEEAYSYIFVICAGMITTIAYNMFAGILRSLGNSRTSLYFLVVSSILNICMDLLFVAVFKMGVAGAALATVIAQGISGLLCGIYIYRHYRNLLPGKEDFKASKALLKELLTNGLAMALMYCVVDLGSVVFQRANNSLGETIISAHTASRKIMGIMMEPLAILSTGSSTFVAQNWGAKKYHRIRYALKQVMLLEIGISLFFCAIVYLLGGWMVVLTTGTSNQEIIDNAVLSLRWHLPLFPALGCLLVLRTAMQAMDKKTAPILSSCIELLMKILSAAFLVPSLGYLGSCLTEPITWVLMVAFLAINYFAVRKKLYPDLPEKGTIKETKIQEAKETIKKDF